VPTSAFILIIYGENTKNQPMLGGQKKKQKISLTIKLGTALGIVHITGSHSEVILSMDIIYILGNVPFPGRIYDAGIEKCTVCAFVQETVREAVDTYCVAKLKC